jgi:hypothetical protein
VLARFHPARAERFIAVAGSADRTVSASELSMKTVIGIAGRRIPLFRVWVRWLKRRRGLAARRQQMALAATLAWDIRNSKPFARAFRDIADQAGIPETRAGTSAQHRLLTYLGFEAPASAMSRACRQIDACLEAGWDKNEIERRMMAGPSKIA